MKPRTRQVLAALQRAADANGTGDGWVCARQLAHPKVGGWRYSARLHEIREAGIDLERRVCRHCERCRYARAQARERGETPPRYYAFRLADGQEVAA